MKSLIIYFSRRGENYINGMVQDITKGNCEIVAEIVKEITGADVFEVQTLVPYPVEYEKVIEQTQEEYRVKARPELKEYLDDISAYDRIILVGPNWWDTYPMAMFTELERLDWKGKTVYPCITHEDSGMGFLMRDIHRFCRGATIKDGLAIRGTDVSQAGGLLKAWLDL
ncbi:MAG: NAD(P)H-dependent oxidoreductase [Erysipelotrichaceae bacterium]|nr:NAD(P)H-dependent oxidoreductase [Erysipelotrichaceae bacterium]